MMKVLRMTLAGCLAAALASCSRQDAAPAPPPPMEVESTNTVAAPAKPQMHPAILVRFSGDDETVIAERYSLGDELEIRFGPGRLYPTVPDAQALKGSKVYILEERDGWCRFKTSRDGGASKWTVGLCKAPETTCIASSCSR